MRFILALCVLAVAVAVSTADAQDAAAPADPDAAKGKTAFEAKCVACHTMGGGDKVGPDLRGVTKRRGDAWLTKWLLDTEQMQKTDPVGKALLAKYKTPMPNQGLNQDEVRQILKFLHWNDGRKQTAQR
ncbi:MAG TPA: cytochrome c [Burkholderiales bacterium]|nr:cytochrome c [Burkholderiales bacterium]